LIPPAAASRARRPGSRHLEILQDRNGFEDLAATIDDDDLSAGVLAERRSVEIAGRRDAAVLVFDLA
jgi:hypothetical protein